MSRVTVSLWLAFCACAVCADDQPKEKVAKDQPKETIAALAGDYYKGDGRLCLAPEFITRSSALRGRPGDVEPDRAGAVVRV
jgi:hypothetical protein